MVYSYQQKTRKLNQRNILDRKRAKLEISLSASTSENMAKCSLIFVHSFFVVRCSRVFNSQPKEVLVSNRIVIIRELTQFKTTMISHQHSVKRTMKRNSWTDGVHRKFQSFNQCLTQRGPASHGFDKRRGHRYINIFLI